MSSAGDLKRTLQQTWAAGDFSAVGAAGVLMGELLCDAIKLHAGERVLDVATGAGNTALSAARRGAQVIGVDFVPYLLERARERAQAERLRHVTFQEGDTEALPFDAGSFDVVLSTFGHMFAPDPELAAAEMARVCRPGGRIGFTAWIPEGFTGEMFRTVSNYRPPPPGVPPPTQWGVESIARQRFEKYAADFSFRRGTHLFRAPTPEHWVGFMRENFGPMKTTFESLDATGQDALTRDLLELVRAHNDSGDATVYLPGAYLEAVVRLT